MKYCFRVAVYLIDDFGTSISCSTTRRSKACPVQLVVWRHSFTRIIGLRSRAHLLQTDKILSSRPQHWQHFSPISLTWVQSDTLGFLCSFRHFSVHSSNTCAALTVYHLLEISSCHLSLSICILRPFLIVTTVISFSKLTASWSEASHKETTTYLHGYTSVLTVSLLNIDITRNRRLRTVVNDTYWLSTL